MIRFLLVLAVACGPRPGDDDDCEGEVVEECPTVSSRLDRCPGGDPECCENAGLRDCEWGMFSIRIGGEQCMADYCAGYVEGGGCCSSSFDPDGYNCICDTVDDGD